MTAGDKRGFVTLMRWLQRGMGEKPERWSAGRITFYFLGLEGLTLAQVEAAVRAGAGVWRYFPKPVEIRELAPHVAEVPQALMLPAPTLTPEQRKANRAKLAAIVRTVTQRRSIE